jgi:ankyrin repeat protein
MGRAFQQIPGGLSPALESCIRSIPADQQNIGKVFLLSTQSTTPLRAALDSQFGLFRLYFHLGNRDLAVQRTLDVLNRFGLVVPILKLRFSFANTLQYAIRACNPTAVSHLLSIESLRSTIDRADPSGLTPVHEALESHSFEILQLLAHKGATIDLNKQRDPRHCLSAVQASYLHVLASLRITDPAFANLLFHHGVPATVKDNRGASVLSLALTRGSFELASLLIKNGASLNEHGMFGVTPLGQLFIPAAAGQYDDLVATLKYVCTQNSP